MILGVIDSDLPFALPLPGPVTHEVDGDRAAGRVVDDRGEGVCDLLEAVTTERHRPLARSSHRRRRVPVRPEPGVHSGGRRVHEEDGEIADAAILEEFDVRERDSDDGPASRAAVHDQCEVSLTVDRGIGTAGHCARLGGAQPRDLEFVIIDLGIHPVLARAVDVTDREELGAVAYGRRIHHLHLNGPRLLVHEHGARHVIPERPDSLINPVEMRGACRSHGRRRLQRVDHLAGRHYLAVANRQGALGDVQDGHRAATLTEFGPDVADHVGDDEQVSVVAGESDRDAGSGLGPGDGEVGDQPLALIIESRDAEVEVDGQINGVTVVQFGQGVEEGRALGAVDEPLLRAAVEEPGDHLADAPEAGLEPLQRLRNGGGVRPEPARTVLKGALQVVLFQLRWRRSEQGLGPRRVPRHRQAQPIAGLHHERLHQDVR